MRRGDAEVGAQRDQMRLRHRHGDAAQEGCDREHREHHVRRPAEHLGSGEPFRKSLVVNDLNLALCIRARR